MFERVFPSVAKLLRLPQRIHSGTEAGSPFGGTFGASARRVAKPQEAAKVIARVEDFSISIAGKIRRSCKRRKNHFHIAGSLNSS